MRQMNIQDENWVALARSGDRAAMHELYERHRTRIFNLAYRYVRNVPDAEDILQETFIKAFRSLEKSQLDDETYFSTWLYRIAVNCAMDHFRRQRRREGDDGWHRDLLASEEGAAPLSPEAACLQQETMARVQQVLAGLSSRKRMIVVLRHYQQLKIQEIAGLLGCSQGSVKKQLFQALAQLRVGMNVSGGGECHEMQ
jgi:RNA polymerase sigma-70 factor (ECF subfamily)